MDTLATVPEGGGRKEHSEVKSLALHGHPMLDDRKNKYQLHTCVSETVYFKTGLSVFLNSWQRVLCTNFPAGLFSTLSAMPLLRPLFLLGLLNSFFCHSLWSSVIPPKPASPPLFALSPPICSGPLSEEAYGTYCPHSARNLVTKHTCHCRGLVRANHCPSESAEHIPSRQGTLHTCRAHGVREMSTFKCLRLSCLVYFP